MQENEAQPFMETIELRDYLNVLQKWRWVVVLVTITAVVTSGILSFFVLPPIYQTKVTLLVTRASERQTVRQEQGLEAVVNTLSRIPELTVNTYVGQLQSLGLMNRVIRELKLDPELYTANSLQSMVEVKAIKDTNLIELTVENTDPDLAVAIANKLSTEFLNFISETNQEQMTRSVSFLTGQLKEVEEQLSAASNRFKEFEARPRSTDFLEKQLVAKSNDVARYRSQLVQLEVEVELLEAGVAAIEARLAETPPVIVVEESSTSAPAVPSSPEGEGAPAESRGAPAQLVRREEVNPAYLNLKQTLDEKQVALAQKRAEHRGLVRTISTLEGEINSLQAELAEKRMERDRLQKEIAQLEQTYLLLTGKITETQIAKSLNLGETTVQIVSPALRPVSPVKPKRKLNMAIAGVLGLMVSVGLVFLLEYLDNTIKTADDVERHLGVPVLGSIPRFSGASLRR